MIRLSLDSQRYDPDGGSSAQGIAESTRSSTVDPLEVAVREALQNSWDARLRSSREVGFSWHLINIGPRESDVLTHSVFAELPRDGWSPGEAMQPGSRLLAFADTGTTGLRGPTRADWATGDHTEFVDFVRNHGRTKRGAGAGETAGTFGFGKSALLNLSSIKTAIVYSRTGVGTTTESRFIAMALGHEFAAEYAGHEVLHTGRHWWGISGGDNGRVDPVTGSQADELADAMHLGTLLGNATGTVIALLQPTWTDHTEADADRVMSEQALRYAWPVLESTQAPRLHLYRSWLGEPAEVRPLPGDHAHSALARCLAAIDGGPVPSVQVHEVWCHRPRRRLGVLALSLLPLMPSPTTSVLAPLGDPLHHVALMRDQRLVLRYLPVDAAPPGWQILGVFISDPGLAALFAQSESATHDDWIPERIADRTERSLVRMAKQRIGELARTAFDPGEPQPPSQALPLGGFSSYLGAWLAGAYGAGAAVPDTGGDGRGGTGRRPRRTHGRTALDVLPTDEPRSIAVFDGVPASIIPFSVRIDEGHAMVTCSADVVVDGSRAEGAEAPAGASKPRLLAWLGSGRRRLGDASTINISVTHPNPRMYAVVSLPPDSLVTISIVAEASQVGDLE